MSTEIKIWQISDGRIRQVEETDLAAERLESDLERWIVESPDILGEDLLIIAKEKEIQDVGRLDLLAIQPDGELVIVELKRDMMRREAVTQALDYASWLDQISEGDLLEIAQEYLQRPLEEAFAEKFGVKDMPAIFPRNHRILLVGSRLDAAAERLINYLAQRHSVNINAVFFQYAKLSSGQEILARSVLVAESVLQSMTSSRRKPTVAELTALAATRDILQMVQAFRELAKDEKYASEEPQNTYGGSFRYWRRNIEGKAKMVLGVNVSGQRKDTPVGQLDIWIPVGVLAQVLGISEPQAKELIKKLPVFEMKGIDAIVRVKDEASANEVANQIEGWFQKYPGFHQHTAAKTA